MISNSPIISAGELGKFMQEEEMLVLLDARSGKHAKRDYLEGHLKGARFIDLESDLSKGAIHPELGGRHPLPEISDFAKTLQRLGIHKNSKIVVYDDLSGANAAARAWWMLRSAGLSSVQVLDGGMQKAIDMGLETESGKMEIEPGELLPITDWQLPLIDRNQVKEKLEAGELQLIDVREEERYNGNREPIDPIAGHIPGAINIPFAENLNDRGTFLPKEELEKKYSTFNQDSNKNIAVHCGSGVTACHTLLAFEIADLPLPALYVGSWSEWCRNLDDQNN